MAERAKTIDELRRDENLKLNVLELADDHRQRCGPGCTISLVLVAMLLEQAGIELTDDDRRRLM